MNQEIAQVFIKDLFLNESFSDVIFKVQGQQFPAHKVILAQRSKYFSDLFLNEMADSTPNEISFQEKASTFKAMLSFIYYNEVKSVDEDLAIELFEISNRFSLPDLKKRTEEFLSERLSYNNYIRLANLVDKFEAPILKENIVEFLKREEATYPEKYSLIDLPKRILVEMYKTEKMKLKFSK